MRPSHHGNETTSRKVNAVHFIITTFCFILGIRELSGKDDITPLERNHSRKSKCCTFHYNNILFYFRNPWTFW